MKLNGIEQIEVSTAGHSFRCGSVSVLDKALAEWDRGKSRDAEWVFCGWDGVTRRLDQIKALAIV